MKKGFTLAEVLITLAVIGVIAAITITSAIKNYQKQVMLNKLKENYNLLSQAFERAISEHEAPANWTYDDNNVDFFVENYLAPYLKIIKKSTTAPAHTGFNGTKPDKPYKKSKYYYLANGTEFVVFWYSTWKETHYFIDFDINGTKGPNIYGKDTFRMQFSKTSKSLSIAKSFIFNGFGSEMSSIKSICKSSTGAFCGAWIMLEGWKIPKDYPW